MLKLKSGPQFFSRTFGVDKGDSESIIGNWLFKEHIADTFDQSEFKTVVDIGAHIGTFSIYAGLRFPRAVVLSYEPILENFQLLQKNIELNKLRSVKAFNLGVAGKKGILTLSRADSITSSGHESVSWSLYEKGARSVSVEFVSLEDIFKDNLLTCCDFLKIDCEGAEYDILLNTPKQVLQKVRLISMEYHDYLFEKQKLGSVLSYLSDCGFSYHIIDNPYQKGMGLIHAAQEDSKVLTN